MKAERLSLEDLEDQALDALFQRGIRLRLYLAPFIFLSAVSLLALDPARWRLWAVGLAVLFATVRLGIEAVRARRTGLERTRLNVLLPVPATILVIVVTASGGVESPIVVMLPMVTVFLSLFLRARFGFIFAAVGSLVVPALCLVEYSGVLLTFIPEAFGGGARGAATDLLLFTRAAFLLIALWWGALLGWVIRMAFQSAIQGALNARDELLQSHTETTKTLTTLVAEIAHELKNPLASVKGLAALVDRDATGKEKERVVVLRREVDRMQEILESFLNFSRPVVPLDIAPLALATVAEQCAALHEGIARERSISIRLDVRPDVVVKADERKVKQIVINLVQNALDVTEAGGAIDLVVGTDAAGGKLSVMDRGPGLKDIERAFEPGVTTKEKGNGLGLTIARLAARQHGGDVRLALRDGGGTVAELTLPEAPPS